MGILDILNDEDKMNLSNNKSDLFYHPYLQTSQLCYCHYVTNKRSKFMF